MVLTPVAGQETEKVPKESTHVRPMTRLWALALGGTWVYSSPVRFSRMRVRPLGYTSRELPRKRVVGAEVRSYE